MIRSVSSLLSPFLPGAPPSVIVHCSSANPDWELPSSVAFYASVSLLILIFIFLSTFIFLLSSLLAINFCCSRSALNSSVWFWSTVCLSDFCGAYRDKIDPWRSSPHFCAPTLNERPSQVHSSVITKLVAIEFLLKFFLLIISCLFVWNHR